METGCGSVSIHGLSYAAQSEHTRSVRVHDLLFGTINYSMAKAMVSSRSGLTLTMLPLQIGVIATSDPGFEISSCLPP